MPVARWSADRAQLVGLLEGCAGPRWIADELDLVRSEHRGSGPQYCSVQCVPVTRGGSG